MSSVACVSFDGIQCRINLKYLTQPWEQSKTTHRFILHDTDTTHIVLSQNSYGRGGAPMKTPCPLLPKPLSVPNMLVWKQVSSVENISPLSPPGTFLCCAKQTAHCFLPSLLRQPSHSLVCSSYKLWWARRGELGCCCSHCRNWKPWRAEADTKLPFQQ